MPDDISWSGSVYQVTVLFVIVLGCCFFGVELLFLVWSKEHAQVNSEDEESVILEQTTQICCTFELISLVCCQMDNRLVLLLFFLI